MSVKVRVRNFQSLEDVSLTIDGLTVVTGTNNAGKSALFRAIQGAFVNRSGNTFVRHGAKNCTVDLEFDDGQKLTWEKGAKGQKINRYVINGKPYDNVGAGVPPEVADFGVNPVILNDDKYWPQIARQVTDVNFLLDRPGSVMAEAVADVERVNQLNRALKYCESDRKKARSSLRVRRADAKELAVKMTHYQGLDEVTAKIDSLALKQDKLRKMRQVHTDLEKIKGRWENAKQAVSFLEGVDSISLPDEEQATKAARTHKLLKEMQSLHHRLVEAKKAVKVLAGIGLVSLPSEEQATKASDIRKQLEELHGLRSRLQEAQGEVAKSGGVKDAEGLVPNWSDERLGKIERTKKVLQATRDIQQRLSKAQETLGSLQKVREDANCQLADAEQQVKSILGDMEECPTCGKPF